MPEVIWRRLDEVSDSYLRGTLQDLGTVRGGWPTSPTSAESLPSAPHSAQLGRRRESDSFARNLGVEKVLQAAPASARTSARTSVLGPPKPLTLQGESKYGVLGKMPSSTTTAEYGLAQGPAKKDATTQQSVAQQSAAQHDSAKSLAQVPTAASLHDLSVDAILKKCMQEAKAKPVPASVAKLASTALAEWPAVQYLKLQTPGEKVPRSGSGGGTGQWKKRSNQIPGRAAEETPRRRHSR